MISLEMRVICIILVKLSSRLRTAIEGFLVQQVDVAGVRHVHAGLFVKRSPFVLVIHSKSVHLLVLLLPRSA